MGGSLFGSGGVGWGGIGMGAGAKRQETRGVGRMPGATGRLIGSTFLC